MPAKNTLFPVESIVAQRQPKTDRLILERLLKSAALDNRLEEDVLRAADVILVKWADMETSGTLATLSETQLQGDFLAQVWGESLDYPGPADGLALWHRIQHHFTVGETNRDSLTDLGPGRSKRRDDIPVPAEHRKLV